MSAPTPKIYHQTDLLLPLATPDLVISELLDTPQIGKLEARLLATGESSGWADAVRERTEQLMLIQPALSCKQIRDKIRKEVWEGWDEASVVEKQCHLDVPSSGRCEIAGKFLLSLPTRLFKEDIKDKVQGCSMGVTSLGETR